MFVEQVDHGCLGPLSLLGLSWGLVACPWMQGVQVRSLFGELRSHMPHGQKKKTKKKRETEAEL